MTLKLDRNLYFSLPLMMQTHVIILGPPAGSWSPCWQQQISVFSSVFAQVGDRFINPGAFLHHTTWKMQLDLFCWNYNISLDKLIFHSTFSNLSSIWRLLNLFVFPHVLSSYNKWSNNISDNNHPPNLCSQFVLCFNMTDISSLWLNWDKSLQPGSKSEARWVEALIAL